MVLALRAVERLAVRLMQADLVSKVDGKRPALLGTVGKSIFLSRIGRWLLILARSLRVLAKSRQVFIGVEPKVASHVDLLVYL